ncbi:MAG TPA: TonB-dependent receptor [Rhizomicrobium sp.]|nr:TonB-dependent receptor [Rhizomicrobium sp.]
MLANRKSLHPKISALSGASFGVLGAFLLASPASAQPVQLGPVSVEDRASSYQAQSADPRRTAPLRDTPQTVTVITDKLIADQNLLNLRDVLTNTVPGITFTAGEGGGGYGDGINLRGYTATSDITIDGVRDSAQYTRSDPFNIQQIEVVNGANSVYSGGGSVSGGINLISKTPTGTDFALVTAGGGTDDYGRLTVDAERALDDGISLRLNAMLHSNDAPGRDVEKFSRYGFAPSIALGLNSPTVFTLSYFFQHDDNIPQYGQPFFFNPFNTGGLPGVDRSTYFGYSNRDRQKINTHMATGLVTHRFSDSLSLRNLSRYSRVTQLTLVNPPRGAICTLAGIDPATGTACTPAGTLTPSGGGTTRDALNTTLYNQTDLTWHGTLAGMEHNVVLGASFLSEDFELVTSNSQRTTAGDAPAYPAKDILNPDNIYRGPINTFLTNSQDGERSAQAIYLFDDIKLTEQFSLNAGIRYDHNEGNNTTTTFAVPSGTATPGPIFRNQEDLLSYRAGLVFKPVEEASFYVAYSNSRTPSQSAVNGACVAASCNVSPEKAVNYEIGAKWDPLPYLSLTLALFRNERTNYKVPSNDPTVPDQVLDGASRVDGIALSATGTITEGWDIYASYAYLDSEVTQAVSDFCLANPTHTNCVGPIAGIGNNQPIAGNPLTNTPDHALSIWTTYRVLPQWNVGYGITYQGDYYLNNGAAPLFKNGSFLTNRAMVAYDVTENVTLQANVNNLFDEHYFIRIRNNAAGWATPGDGRSFTFTGSYRF